MNEVQTIQNKIYEIRGQRVMLDKYLAAMYGVETKALNQAVKRNIQRFEGDDFMFRLTKDETESVVLRSQTVTMETTANKELLVDSSCSRSQIVILKSGRGQHKSSCLMPLRGLGVRCYRECY